MGGCANWGGRRAYIVTQETFRRIEIVAVQVPTQRRILVLAAVVEVVALRSVPPLRFQPLAKPPGVLVFDGGGRGRLALEVLVQVQGRRRVAHLPVDLLVGELENVGFAPLTDPLPFLLVVHLGN